MERALNLVKPTFEYLPGFLAALARGWSPDNLRPEAAGEILAMAQNDPGAFIAAQDDPEALGGDITLPDGSKVKRLPGLHLWLWDGEFCGQMGLRWQTRTAELPPHCLGHIGYAVVPWKRGRGYATLGLGLLLAKAREVGLPHVTICTTPDNLPSQKVITANGGRLVRRFEKLPSLGGGEEVVFQIDL